MIEPFFETIRYCFAVVFFAALASTGRANGESRLTLPVWLGGIVAGTVLAFTYAWYEWRNPAEAIVMLAATPFFAGTLLLGRMPDSKAARITCLSAALLLLAQRSAALASFVLYKSLDRVHVLNTEFLLFHGGIVIGFVLLSTAGLALSRLAAQSRDGFRKLVTAGVILLLLGEHLSWGYYALVLKGWVSLPESLFAPVVYVINHVRFFGYAQMALAAVFGTGCLLLREKPDVGRMRGMNPAHRRKVLWKIRKQWRFAVIFLSTAGITVGVSVYYTVYASQPPQLSPPIRVEAKDGRIAIPVDKFQPEDFRRYAYTDGEGHNIRFIVLKDETGTIRAAYDACHFCGSKGYLKQGKDLVCLACGAAIYAPTVGREGGCNPVPLAHSTENGALVIRVDALVKGPGAHLFSGADEGHS